MWPRHRVSPVPWLEFYIATQSCCSLVVEIRPAADLVGDTMNITFLSNYFNHHQSALCNALNEKAEAFHFIATSEMRAERKQLGYGTVSPEYVIRAHDSQENTALSLRRIEESDITIIGSAPEQLIAARKKAGKLIFRYMERPLRKGPEPLKYLPRLIRWNMRSPATKPIYLLCASAYTSGDYAQFGMFRNRAFKWGYYTQTIEYDDTELLFQKKNSRKILWVARFLPLKHPEMVLEVARRLREEGIAYELDFIGTGELEPWVQSRIESLGLESCVHLLGAMKPEQVRQHMETAGIFLATSDRQEGWGAVVNEAMNSGCAVVASHAMGSVPYLIENEKNGLIFQSENIDMLYEKVKSLLERPDRQQELGRQAYETITTLWNAEVAAQRLIALSERILAGEKHPDLFESGPCSRAEILHDEWVQ